MLPDRHDVEEPLGPQRDSTRDLDWLRRNLPDCSVVRPTLDRNAGAVATIRSFTADQLFKGQSPQFFSTVMRLARAADAAQRHVA